MKTISDIELEITCLERLKDKTVTYRKHVFDWLSHLGHTHLLSHFNDLDNDINLKLETYKKELEELRKAEDDEKR